MKPLRIYVDTSVFGGMYDDEFRTASQQFFDQVKQHKFMLVISAVVQDELLPAPAEVRTFFDAMLPEAEIIDVSEAALELRDAYLCMGIVSSKYADDALHVALATVSECTSIVSWNFKHIVHFQKIPLYNAINTIHGYPQIAIYSPLEMIYYDDDENI